MTRMAKAYETFDHTADVGLAASADTVEELFEALAEALADFICPIKQVAGARQRHLTVRAEDIEVLAVDFLSAVLNVIQTEHYMVAAVRVAPVKDNVISAELMGEVYDASRHEIHTEVKAVTYCQLKIAHEKGRWIGRVVLDL